MLISHIQELSSHVWAVATTLDSADLGQGSFATHVTNMNINIQTPFHLLNNIYMYTLNLCKVLGKQRKITRWCFSWRRSERSEKRDDRAHKITLGAKCRGQGAQSTAEFTSVCYRRQQQQQQSYC